MRKKNEKVVTEIKKKKTCMSDVGSKIALTASTDETDSCPE
jgi:hypothetical protein